jgi:transposase
MVCPVIAAEGCKRSWLVVERPPSFAPNLNPVEAFWCNRKSTELANLCADITVETEFHA